jgi:hypothetical protein
MLQGAAQERDAVRFELVLARNFLEPLLQQQQQQELGPSQQQQELRSSQQQQELGPTRQQQQHDLEHLPVQELLQSWDQNSLPEFTDLATAAEALSMLFDDSVGEPADRVQRQLEGDMYFLTQYVPADSPAVARFVADYSWLQVWGNRGQVQRFGVTLSRMMGGLWQVGVAS